MLSLYALAFELGLANRALNHAQYDQLIAEINSAPEIIRTTIAANNTRAEEFARTVAEAPAYYILGGGPSYATAMFIAAKLFEMPQSHRVPVELEEWAHEQYFLTRSGTVIRVIAPPGKGLSRVREQMQGGTWVRRSSLSATRMTRRPPPLRT